MRIFIDTEFIEDGKTIDLISIALVDSNGREFYAESLDVDLFKASDWVKENVLPHLWSRHTDKSEHNRWIRHGGSGGLMKRAEIASSILKFIGPEKPEFWGYYSAYDWVALCQLYGTMVQLPKGWPMFCRDIIQECKRIGNPTLPPQGKGEHNALADARWNKMAYDFLITEALRIPVDPNLLKQD